MALTDLPKETVARTIEWYESIEDPEIRDNSFVALEYFIAVGNPPYPPIHSFLQAYWALGLVKLTPEF